MDTAIARLSVMRIDRITTTVPAIYEPRMSLVVQGCKRGILNGTPFEYGEGSILITAVPLPVLSTVCQATPERPFLALTLALDPVLLAEMAEHIPTSSAPQSPLSGFALAPLETALLEAIVHLAELLLRPQEIPALAPLHEREVLYRLLTSRAGASLRDSLEAGKIGSRIGKSVTWIRHHFAEPLRVEELARQACLSPSAFHRHFKATTSMSPLRYQQEIRLQEARRKLLAGTGDIATVGMSVGYSSPSQFSREYRRLFGIPPRQEGLHPQA